MCSDSYSSSSSCSYLVVESLRQTQFSSSQFWTSYFVVPMALMSRLKQSIHLFRSSSSSSPRWYHLQSLSSNVFLVSSLYVAKPPQSYFPAPLCDILYIQSLPGVIDEWYLLLQRGYGDDGDNTFSEDDRFHAQDPWIQDGRHDGESQKLSRCSQ